MLKVKWIFNMMTTKIKCNCLVFWLKFPDVEGTYHVLDLGNSTLIWLHRLVLVTSTFLYFRRYRFLVEIFTKFHIYGIVCMGVLWTRVEQNIFWWCHCISTLQNFRTVVHICKLTAVKLYFYKLLFFITLRSQEPPNQLT